MLLLLFAGIESKVSPMQVPRVLSVAGSDSGGGAGIQASPCHGTARQPSASIGSTMRIKLCRCIIQFTRSHRDNFGAWHQLAMRASVIAMHTCVHAGGPQDMCGAGCVRRNGHHSAHGAEHTRRGRCAHLAGTSRTDSRLSCLQSHAVAVLQHCGAPAGLHPEYGNCQMPIGVAVLSRSVCRRWRL